MGFRVSIFYLSGATSKGNAWLLLVLGLGMPSKSLHADSELSLTLE